MKYTDIAWDFDGCLYDSYPHINSDMQIILARHGVQSSLEEINSYTRVTQGHALKHYAPLCGCSVEDLTKEYRSYKDSYTSDLCQPFPGIPELLRDIAAAGMQNHICSNKEAKKTLMYLDRDNLTQYFGVISGVDKKNGILGKPKPDILNVVLNTRGIKPSALLMVGDRPLDIEAAHNAGCEGCFFDPDRCNVKPDDAEYEAYTADILRKIIFGD